MRHAFVPMSNGSDRCARCLRHLDCVPHLPIAPSSTTPLPANAIGKNTWPGIRRHVLAQLEVTRREFEAVRAAR